MESYSYLEEIYDKILKYQTKKIYEEHGFDTKESERIYSESERTRSP